jgi:hypothetical protein
VQVLDVAIRDTIHRYNGVDWLIHVLSTTNIDMNARTLLLLWRAWHHRNDIMHRKGQATISGSAEFLKNYAFFWMLQGKGSMEEPTIKGKRRFRRDLSEGYTSRRVGRHRLAATKGWVAPHHPGVLVGKTCRRTLTVDDVAVRRPKQRTKNEHATFCRYRGNFFCF